jgi:hypothetical protein
VGESLARGERVMQARTSKLRRWRTRSSGDRRLSPPYDVPHHSDPHVVEARQFLHRALKRLTALFLLREQESTMNGRASGEAVCTTCKQLYVDHVRHPNAKWLTVLCDGRRVKL